MSTLFKSVLGAFVAIFATISAFAANVAKIGDVNYSSISDAINAANAGETIELLSNVSVSGYFVYNKSFTIDGNGYTISCTSPNSNYPNYFVNVANGYSQTFKNMTIDANEKVPYAIQCIGSSSTLNLDNVIVKGGKTMKTKGKNDSYSQTRLGYGIHVNGGKVIANNLKVQNCTVTAAYLTGTSSNGTSPSFALSGDSCEIDVIGASEMDSLTPSITSSAKGCSVYDVEVKYSYIVVMTKTMKARIISSMGWNSLIDQVVEMASISPKSATVKLLQDVVLAETFVSNDTKLSIDGNGKTVTGTIKFTSSPSAVNNVVLGDGSTLDFTESENSGFSNVSVAANTGITILLPASANIESYTVPVALGTDATATIMVGDNKYIAKNGVIAPAETVAQIGDARYSTLQAAIDAAANGAIIHVLKDVALKGSLTVASGKSVTLNLAGKSVTVSGADYALVNNGTLTIVDLALLTVLAETATVSDDAVPMVIGGVSANAGIAVIGDAVGGSIAGVQNKGVLSLESGLVVAASATVPAIDNAAGAVATIKGGAVEGNLQSVDAKDITVAGGTFTNSNVSEFLDGNQGVDSNGAIVAYVAQLGDAKYQTLEEAFGAAKEFDTVAVLDAEADVSDVASYVAEGLYPISNGDGTYTLRAMPNATVKKLPAFTLSANAYSVWDGSVTEGTTDRPLDIVMNFLANDDGKQEANESGFADWTCDFYLTFSGMAGASLEADGCYLAGNYGGYGWYVIPAEDAIIDNGATIPVMSEYDAHITYRQICETVKKFTAAIHVDEAVMSANPDLKINLSLKMTNDRDPEQEIVVGSYDYTGADLKGELNPAVTVAEGVTVDDTFKANVANALANAYQAAEGNIDVTVVEKGTTFATIDVSAKDGYEIPAEGLEMTFPVTSVSDGETAIIIHKHEGKLYVSSAEAEYGFVTYNNTLGFSEFTVGDAAALNAAIADAENGSTIKLMSDITLSSGLSIGKSIVFDLNGKTVSTSANYFFLLQSGKLTVKDTSSEKTGKLNGVNATGTAGVGNAFLVYDNSELVIENGVIHAYNNVICTYGSGITVTINDGELKSFLGGATPGCPLYLIGGDVAVNGGTLVGPIANWGANLVIKGGIFTEDVTSYCASGYKAEYNAFSGFYEVKEDKVEPVDPSVAGARIGDVCYASLNAALQVAQPTDTIVVLKDFEGVLLPLKGIIVPETGKTVTITDTNTDWCYLGYDFVLESGITLKSNYIFLYAKNAVINGTVITTAYYQSNAGSRLTINEPGSMTVTTESFHVRYMEGDADAGIYVVGDNDDSTVGLKADVIYLYQGVISAKDANIEVAAMFQTNTTDGQGAAKLLLNNSVMKVTNTENSYQIGGNAEVKLTNGAKLTCGCDVNADVGTSVEVTGSEFNARSLTVKGTATFGKNSNVTTVNGVRVFGELIGYGDVNGSIVKNDGAAITLYSGSYTQDVSSWCAAEHRAVAGVPEEGYWTVMQFVAQVGDEKYTSLAEAIEAAESGNVGTITLLGNVDETVTLPDGYTISANGFTVGSVVDSNGHIVEKVDGAYVAGNNPTIPPVRSIVINEDTVELRFVPRAALSYVKVMVTTDLKAWSEMTDAIVTDNGIGKETVVVAPKPEGGSAFFKLVFEYESVSK